MATMPQPAAAPPWHAWEPDAVLAHLACDRRGLSDEEAGQRLAQYGPNRLPAPRRRGPLVRLLEQFHNILIYILLVCALATSLLHHWVDTGVIIGVVLVNAVVGFIQEGKAERSLEAIRNLLSPKASVLRGAVPVVVDAEALVPGDVVLLRAGDKVPADLRLFRVKDLRIEEAMLTGESVPVEKATATVAESTVVGDRVGMAYSGTLVTYGQASGVVVATAGATEIGRISALLAHVQTLTTPLLRQMGVFGRWLTAAILFLAGATFGFGVLVRGYPVSDMFLASVGLAVAAIPEGLPAIITITLAIGVQHMARRNAIIRRLPAVETLGAVDVICSDKTGTLTRNEMTVKTVVTAGARYQVGGAGYAPHGGFSCGGRLRAVEDDPDLTEVARAALLCNDAVLRQRGDVWVLQGDPTDGSLLTLGLKAGVDLSLQQREYPRTDSIPFESEHRFMATLHHDHAGHGFIYVKGAPERVLQMCSRHRLAGADHPLDLHYWEEHLESVARLGERTLALAFRATNAEHCELRFDDVEGGLTLLAIVGIIDPPREEAIRAVHACQDAGIRVKMVTGDHALTASAVGAQLGIGDGRTAVIGERLEVLGDEALRDVAQSVDVVARASPEHKLRLVQALQACGRVVAMTGDGVNDAPALKRADVGVAMGIKGTEVAKEAAEMVLADDNFASIAGAVEEGRTVYDNIKKSILFILPTNGGEALIIVAAILLGHLLPITPVQILWVNMITAVTLALSLAFEPPETDVMARAPRPPGEPILSGFLAWRIVLVAILMVLGSFGLFLWERAQGASIDAARTVTVNTLVMFESFYLLNTRYITASVVSWEGLLGNRYVLFAIFLVSAFQVLFTYAPPMQYLFSTQAIDLFSWARIVLVGASVYVLVEAEKCWLRVCQRGRAGAPARSRSAGVSRE